MTSGAMPDPFQSRCRDIVARARQQHREQRGEAWAWRTPSATTLELELGELSVVVELSPSAGRGTLRLGEGLHAAYRLVGSSTPAGQARARSALEELLGRLAEPRDSGAAVVSSAAELAALLATEARGADPLHLSADLAARPETLRDVIGPSYRSALASGRAPRRVVGLPLCLELDQRPASRPALGESIAPPSGSCARCGAAARCPASARASAEDRSRLRALAHGDSDVAVWSCVDALGDAFPGATSDGQRLARRALAGFLESRRGLLSLPPLPLEVSLKARGARLLPQLRVTEYPPSYDGRLELRATHGQARRERALGLFDALGARDSTGAYERWMERLVELEGDGLEASYGVEVDLERGATRAQAYAHVGTADRERMRATTSAVLGWLEVDAAARRALAQLLARQDASVELIAWSPEEDGGAGVKLYVRLPPASTDPATGLTPAALGALGDHAGGVALAVCQVSRQRLAWRKWDFPITTHYQLAAPLAAAFSEGLDEQSGRSARRLLGGERFSAWPTWMSVGLGAGEARTRALYFVPR